MGLEPTYRKGRSPKCQPMRSAWYVIARCFRLCPNSPVGEGVGSPTGLLGNETSRGRVIETEYLPRGGSSAFHRSPPPSA